MHHFARGEHRRTTQTHSRSHFVLAALFGGIVALASAWSSRAFDTLRVQRIEVVGEDGVTYCRIGEWLSGSSERGISLCDGAGQERLRLSVSNSGLPRIMLKDTDDNMRMLMDVGLTGGISIVQYGADGMGRAHLSVRDHARKRDESSTDRARPDSEPEVMWGGSLTVIDAKGETIVVGGR